MTVRPSQHPAAISLSGGRETLTRIVGREVNRDTFGALRGIGFIASGPRSPTPGTPYAYVTTKNVLPALGLETLSDFPNIEALKDAGLLRRVAVQEERISTEVESEDDHGCCRWRKGVGLSISIWGTPAHFSAAMFRQSMPENVFNPLC